MEGKDQYEHEDPQFQTDISKKVSTNNEESQ